MHARVGVNGHMGLTVVFGLFGWYTTNSTSFRSCPCWFCAIWSTANYSRTYWRKQGTTAYLRSSFYTSAVLGLSATSGFTATSACTCNNAGYSTSSTICWPSRN